MAGKEAARSRAASISPAKGDEEVSAGLSAILGDLVLMEKEVTGIIIRGQEQLQAPKPPMGGRW
jgi:hypothetical protein